MKFQFTLKDLALCVAVVAIPTQTTADEIKLEPIAKPACAKEVPVAKVDSSSKVRPMSVTVDLVSSTKIQGTLTDTTQHDVQISFGVANISLSEVAGIKFASADNPSTTVIMLNGDSITNATDVKLVTDDTEWGIAAINGSSISSILFIPDVDWNPQAGLNGKRRTLANGPKTDKPAATKTTTQSTVGVNGQIIYANGSAHPNQVYHGR
jgi:hypothetical protein